jgi:lipase chaperone LimK
VRRKLGWLAVALLVAGALYTRSASRRARVRAEQPPAPVVRARPAPLSSTQVRARVAEKALAEPVLPASLAGSDVPRLTLDPRGELVLDLRLRRLFDYFLTAHGELSPEGLRALIHAALARQLSGRSLVTARALLDDYLALRQAELRARLVSSRLSLADQVAARHARRRQYLAPDVADAFFAADEQRDLHALARAQARASGAAADEAEAAAASLLTPQQRAEREQTFVLAGLRAEAAEGAPPGTSVDLSAFDVDAPRRLSELRMRQADFARRRAAYRAAQQGRSGASEDELRRVAADLGLDEREFRRLQALETLR